MDLRQLRYFVAVAEELSFTRAAVRIGMAQPPLSQQVLRLETELGVKLFVRSKRKVALTPAGVVLLGHARRLLNATRQAAADVQATASGRHGRISIGSIFSAIYVLIPPTLRSFSIGFPDVKAIVQEMTIAQQVEALRDGRIDVGFARGPLRDPEIEATTLFSEPFVVALPAEHPLGRKAAIGIEDLAAEPHISVAPSLNRDYSQKMIGLLQERGFRPNIAHEVADTHTLIGLVAAGMGLSLVPSLLQDIEIRQAVYRPLREESPTTTIQLIWNRGATSPVLPHFISTAKEACIGFEDRPRT